SFTATEIHYAFRGRLVSLLVLTHCGVSPRPFLPQESPCISSAGIAFTTISYSSTSTKININHITSPGERRAVTPGSAITRPTENICGNSTCPKTPQRGYYLSKLLCSLVPRKHAPKRY